MKRLFPWLAAVELLSVSPAAADKPDRQVWTTASATVRLSDRWRLSQEVVARFSHNRDGLYEVESNTLLGYKLTKGMTLWAGYTHDPQYSAGHFTVMERRAREQVTFDNLGRLGSGRLSARMRLEERWREGVPGTAWRLRPYLKYSLPLHGKTALNISSELFMNVTETSFQKTTPLDRMRNLVTVSTPLTKHFTGEVGYMAQRGFIRGDEDTRDNIAYFSVSFSG